MLKHFSVFSWGRGEQGKEKGNLSQLWALTHEFCDRDEQKAGEGIDVVRTESIWVRRAQHLSHKSFSQENELLLIWLSAVLGFTRCCWAFSS